MQERNNSPQKRSKSLPDWLKNFLPKEISLKPIDFSNMQTGEFDISKLNEALVGSGKTISWLRKIISDLEEKGAPLEQVAIFKEYLESAQEIQNHFEKLKDEQLTFLDLKRKKEIAESIQKIQEFYNELIEFGEKISMVMKEEAMRLVEKLQKRLRELLDQIRLIDKTITINKNKIKSNQGKVQNNNIQIANNTSQIATNIAQIKGNAQQIEEYERHLLESSFFEQLHHKTKISLITLQERYSKYRYSSSGKTMVEGLHEFAKSSEISVKVMDVVIAELKLESILEGHQVVVTNIKELEAQNGKLHEQNKKLDEQNRKLDEQNAALEKQNEQLEGQKTVLVAEAREVTKEIGLLMPVVIKQVEADPTPEKIEECEKIKEEAVEKISEVVDLDAKSIKELEILKKQLEKRDKDILDILDSGKVIDEQEIAKLEAEVEKNEEKMEELDKKIQDSNQSVEEDRAQLDKLKELTIPSVVPKESASQEADKKLAGKTEDEEVTDSADVSPPLMRKQ